MNDFYFYGRRIGTVFQLLPSVGKLEDDMSRAVGWVLARCPAFLQNFLGEVAGIDIEMESATICFQVIDRLTGRTDLEIEVPGKLYIVVEAKRGWEIPPLVQLEQYATRISKKDAEVKRILVLTDCGSAYAEANLPARQIGEIPVSHLSWYGLARMASEAKTKSTLQQRYLIDELLDYLKGIITLQQIDSNWVYVLSLSSDHPSGWGVSWIDVVTKKGRYFHPVGGSGWPASPPNYLAFRHHGVLQSIHHVESCTVVRDVHEAIPEDPPWRSYR